MKKDYSKLLKLMVLVGTLPFIYGCGGGAGIGSLVGFLFGGGGLSGGDIALLGTSAGGLAGALGASGSQLATINQPEPASMLLLGGGLVAMGFYKSKANRSKK
ncbi:MAG: hypothetical protein A3C36_05800 [Omnitrophica WOR_2 bacterium RIFCSPHIGHO2_02_FULL_52_10]|nr:MAG: hypothetical protein A3C36_05800 [Omnitrophica WOR_2 bacterium RIFCSPHIGHO2_02_FULL_52_10]